MARKNTLSPDHAVRILDLWGIPRGAAFDDVHTLRIDRLTSNCGSYGFNGRTAKRRYYDHVQAKAALALPGLPDSWERITHMFRALREECVAAHAEIQSSFR